ncbi:MAG: 30S ribosome-binding factor RbfA [Eubacteriales bacterium]|nr:30S ribosome-binding factor RbfA [Eubacteriales bacterium]MDD3882303.1 30S ribosome-binding factor RbfA [Eubacteriales bacterium]MDD4512049.1 30S ribosome-binding factor RbfA [Eubacteriales bacterium]
MSGFRMDRINEEVRREIDKIIREDVSDPRVAGTYSITRAEVTRDLKFVKVFVSVLEEDKREPMMEALKSASGFIRRTLSKRVLLRAAPQPLFVLDKNIEYGAHIAEVLKEAGMDKPAAEAEESGDE